MKFSLNNTVPEPDRSFDVIGFQNVPAAPSTGVPQGQGIQTLPHPMGDEVTDHSDTIPYEFPANGVAGIQLDAQLRKG